MNLKGFPAQQISTFAIPTLYRPRVFLFSYNILVKGGHMLDHARPCHRPVSGAAAHSDVRDVCAVMLLYFYPYLTLGVLLVAGIAYFYLHRRKSHA